MKDKIQYEKAKAKMNLLKYHVLDLSKYNSINDYSNIKAYCMKINSKFDQVEKCYNFDVLVTRGTNRPQETLNFRFHYKDKIYDIFYGFINQLISDDNFKYLSYQKDVSNTKNEFFVINMNNDVSVQFNMLDDDDIKFYDKIYNSVPKKDIKSNNVINQITGEVKDIVQIQKAKNIFSNINGIFYNLMQLNGIENYENKKPYKLVIRPSIFLNGNCVSYHLQIVRGSKNPQISTEYNISIKDETIIHEEIHNMILKYSDEPSFLFPSIRWTGLNGELTLYFDNALTIEFVFYDQKDNEFYNNMFELARNKTIGNREKVKKI